MKSNSVVVSVVISVYKQIDDLRYTLETVLNQTLRQIEIVLVDDGNAAEDKLKLAELASRDSRIRLIKKYNNEGLTKSLIHGCRISQGAYIARIDNGDLMVPPSRLEEQLKFLERNKDYAIVGGKHEIVDGINGLWFRDKMSKLADSDLRRISSYKTIFCHVTVMFRKSAYTSVGGYNENFYTGQDTELWPRILRAGKGCVAPRIYAVVRMVPESISVSGNNQQIKAARKRIVQKIKRKEISLVKGGGALLSFSFKMSIPLKIRVFLRYSKSMRLVRVIPKRDCASLRKIVAHCDHRYIVRANDL